MLILGIIKISGFYKDIHSLSEIGNISLFGIIKNILSSFFFWSKTSDNAQLIHLPHTMNAHFSESHFFFSSVCDLTICFLALLRHHKPSCNPQISKQWSSFIKYLDWGKKNLIGFYCQGYQGELLTMNC